jgi:hypothetical protein
MAKMTLQEVISLMESEGYSLDKRPNKLNIVGVRDSKDTQADTFDDVLAYFYYDNNGNVIGKAVEGTTSPGLYWLENPMIGSGTAILKGGQYVDAYKIGLHRSSYEAIRQDKPVIVMRDNDRNGILNFFAPTESGLFGINIHKRYSGNAAIDRSSAGCQVFKNNPDFEEMMTLARKSRDIYGNTFTYTLIDKKDIFSRRLNYGVLGLLFFGLVGYGYYAYKKIKNS